MSNEFVQYDDELDAARAVVQALGGTKQVGPQFWPEKPPLNAARYLSDCLSPGRCERLSPAQVLMLMRMGREKGAHMLAEYFMTAAGYQRPVPINPEMEAGRLIQHIDGVFVQARQLIERLERVRGMGSAA